APLLDEIERAALDAPHAREAAVSRDVRRLRGPRRERAEARNDEEGRDALAPLLRRLRTVREELLEALPLGRARHAVPLDEVAIYGLDATNAGNGLLQGGKQLREPGRRQGGGAAELQDLGH